MSYLLEILGRGLVGSLRGVLIARLPDVDDSAVAQLREAAEATPDDSDALSSWGTRLLLEGRFLQARAVFERALAVDDECVPALLGLASAHDEMGQTRDALAMLNEVRLIEILDPLILFCIGFCHERLGEFGDASDAYNAALRAQPELRNAHERLAAISLQRNDVAKAMEHYEHLVELDPQRIGDRLALANLYLRADMPDDASEQYETAIAMDPDNWELQDDVVSAYDEAGLHEEALEHLQRLIDEQPDFPDNYLRLGDLHGKLGDLDAALGAYETALDLSPEYLEAMVKVGTTCLRLGHFADAAQWFNRAVEINDRLLSACIGLGVSQMHAGRAQEGLASLRLAAKIEPNSSLLFSETARMQLKATAGEHAAQALNSGRSAAEDPAAQLIDRQIALHRRALRSHPNHADLHYRLGLLLRNRNHLDEAITALRAAVRINPVYEKALIKLGLALQEIGDVDGAVTVFEQALALQPEQAQVHYQLGLLFAEKHLFELAIEHFDNARRGLPVPGDIEDNLALALQNAGLLDRAECSWRTTCKLDAYDEPADEPDYRWN